MALVDYDSQDEDEEEEDLGTHPSSAPIILKRKHKDDDLPPLPSRFFDLYATPTRLGTRDNPSQHGGRKRVTPHVDGNWPSHLYIEWSPKTAEYDLLSSLIGIVQHTAADGFKVESSLTSDLGVSVPLHISLSRPIGFVTEVKDDFLGAVKQNIGRCGVRPFDISFVGLDWVPNFEKTRWFLVLRLGRPDADGLNKLLEVCNKTVQEYGQPPLYITARDASFSADLKKLPRAIASDEQKYQDQSSAFHISIGWTLQAPSPDMMNTAATIFKDDNFNGLRNLHFKVDEIKAKIGNIISSIELTSKIVEKRGLFVV